MLIITRTHETGTIIEGTSRGDGTAPILKDQRWRWGRSIGAWYRHNSRDHRPDHLRIRATVAALETAGYDVTQELDESVRPTAEIEAGKIARQAARVDALDAKAERKRNAADVAWDRHIQHVAALPEGGEPIKVVHHSESRHRDAIDRAHDSARRGIDAANDADHAADRANAAAHTTDARYSTCTVHNRIEKIYADIRCLGRKIEADRYDLAIGYVPATAELKQRRAERGAPRLEELRNSLAYWEGVRAAQIDDGTATDYRPQQISKGDAVKIRGEWRRVVRVNPKTVSIQTEYSWTDEADYAAIEEHRPAA